MNTPTDQLLSFCVPFIDDDFDGGGNDSKRIRRSHHSGQTYACAYFGAYPTSDQIDLLRNVANVTLVVDLTEPNEKKCVPYNITNIDNDTSSPCKKLKIIRFSIPDRKGPKNKLKFCKLILLVSDAINRGECVYIHCKGGHGRSGMLAAALLCYIQRIDPKDAILKTTECHAKRIGLKPYWLKLGSPQTWDQKQTIYTLFKSHYITELSPFYSETDDIYLESFLLQTFLGRIVGGEKGIALEEKRKKIIFDSF